MRLVAGACPRSRSRARPIFTAVRNGASWPSFRSAVGSFPIRRRVCRRNRFPIPLDGRVVAAGDWLVTHSPFILILIEMTVSEGVKGGVFVDWITVTEFHPEGGLPLVHDGVVATFDPLGNCRLERAIAKRLEGSHATAVRIRCDGFRVSLSGNVGRLSRPDNLFNLGWRETIAKCNRILEGLGLPPFSDRKGYVGVGVAGHKREGIALGASCTRIDLTCNYRTGSEAQARAVIAWLAGRSVARMKRGFSGDQSVWWSNSRRMLKAYRKGAELLAHGAAANDAAVAFCVAEGIVRVEVELKKRELSDMGLRRIDEITDEGLERAFRDATEVLRAVDMSDEPDILACVPQRSRSYAAAWLGGQDVRLLCSQATLYRHAKVLREHGIDILEPRNVQRFPVRVRIVDLEPVEVPDWYRERAA